MTNRPDLLQNFVTALAQAFEAAPLEPKSTAALARIFEALNTPAASGTGEPKRLPVCRHLEEAYARGREASEPIRRLTDAFAAVEPGLSWVVRPAGGPSASENWPTGHANTTIIGLRGLEERRDLAIGASLLAPDVRYPDHNHRPEEVYILLSPGRFQHGDSEWFEPGVGGTLYNEPNIRHAMASGRVPLLAIWCLWMG